MIYTMIARYKRADMIMKTHKLLWNILFYNQKLGVSHVLKFGTISLIATQKKHLLRVLHLVKFQAVSLHLY